MTWMLAHLLFGGLGMAWLLSRWRLPVAARAVPEALIADCRRRWQEPPPEPQGELLLRTAEGLHALLQADEVRITGKSEP